jgi:hypothetical protein
MTEYCKRTEPHAHSQSRDKVVTQPSVRYEGRVARRRRLVQSRAAGRGGRKKHGILWARRARMWNGHAKKPCPRGERRGGKASPGLGPGAHRQAREPKHGGGAARLRRGRAAMSRATAATAASGSGGDGGSQHRPWAGPFQAADGHGPSPPSRLRDYLPTGKLSPPLDAAARATVARDEWWTRARVACVDVEHARVRFGDEK